MKKHINIVGTRGPQNKYLMSIDAFKDTILLYIVTFMKRCHKAHMLPPEMLKTLRRDVQQPNAVVYLKAGLGKP